MRKPLILVLGIVLAIAHSSHQLNEDNDIIFDENPFKDSSPPWYGKLLTRVKRQFNLFSSFFDDPSEKKTTTTSDAIPTTSTSKPTTGGRETRSPRDEVTNSLSNGYTTDDEDGGLDGTSGSGEVGPVTPDVTFGEDHSKKSLFRMTLTIEEPWNDNFRDKSSPKFQDFAEQLKNDINSLFSNVPGEQTSEIINLEKMDSFFLKATVDIESIANSNSKQLEDVVRNQIKSSKLGGFTVKSDKFMFNRFTVDCSDDEMLCTESDVCVPLSNRCDGVAQCPQSEDEEGCKTSTNINYNLSPALVPARTPTMSCRSDTTPKLCSNDSTAEYCEEQKCDGTKDCPNGEDENNCKSDVSTSRTDTTTSEKSTTEALPQCHGLAKPKECPNSPKLICSDQFCDGKEDCPNGEDENCPDKTTEETSTMTFRPLECEYATFRPCPENSAVFICPSQFCDGIPDCPFGEDEREGYCTEGTTESMPNCKGAIAWYCPTAVSHRVLICSYQICDGMPDCPYGEDEKICPDCLTTEFSCDISRCIPKSSRCDGREDCADGTDEQNCPVVVCSSQEFQCDGSCHSVRERCDGIPHCSDRSDEKNCPPGCPLNERMCDDGQCIASKFWCDMHRDCIDGSDEKNCRPHDSECQSDWFRCKNNHCIHSRYRCDGSYHCNDGSDEMECPLPGCRDDQFTCDDSRCIHKSQVCNSQPDCLDGSDERNCPRDCLQNEFRCKNGLCIQSAYYCDGVKDCTDGSDEQDCNPRPCTPPNNFTCGDNTCIRLDQKCDGIIDCVDGSDETNCRLTCLSSEWQCNSGDCIPINLRCNGQPDCPDGSDETNNECPAPSPPPTPFPCASWQFRCTQSGQCIPKEYHCNNRFDCPDQSDEENCAGIPLPLLKIYERDQIIKESREAVFQCRDEGPGRYKVKWTRERGLPLPSGSRSIEGRLEMPNVQREHSGTYYCEAVGIPPSTTGARVAAHLTVEQLILPPGPSEIACGPGEATCYNRQCILKSQVCDGRFDCGDGSDESRCQNAQLCEPNEFRCNNRKCVLKTWRCDKDDDCGDNSDEMGCEIRKPGSQCFETEFECRSRDQCIPRSFQCDGTNDCQDGSDEIGCYPMKIVKIPQPEIKIIEGSTLVLTCVAEGIPTPEISWRKDWRHVPSKCTQSSIGGTGTLTCPNFQREDSGAYTCEAVNSLTYVISPRDTIVTIETRDICQPGTFNDHATSPADCIPCFCFGQARECTSSNLYIYQLPPPTEFKLINVIISPRKITVKHGETPYSSPQSSGRTSDGFSVQSNPQAFDFVYAYYVLPDRYHGEQLGSYGGYITFTVQTDFTRGQRTDIPDIIILGNDIPLIYKYPGRIESNVPTKISAQLSEADNWFRVTEQGAVRATRTDIMMVLANVNQILLRTQFTDGQGVLSQLSGITMDSAQYHNAGLGKAVLVEKCSCADGYTGFSCEKCDTARNFTRVSSSPWLGECKKYATCPKGTFGDPSRGIPCESCPCPFTTPPAQYSHECYLDTDNLPTCQYCPVGHSGRRCELCAPGYRGNPISGSPCVPDSGDCDQVGSLSPFSSSDGQCACKANVIGPKCTDCKPNTFHLSRFVQHGCISCFCMGITNVCTSSRLFRDQIVAVFTRDNQEFKLAPEDDIQNYVPAQVDQSSLGYSSFQPKVYYWILPKQFLGNQLPSYGGYLTYQLRYVPTHGGLSSRNNAADVKLFSRSRINLYYFRNETVEPDRDQTITVPLLEQYWQREDGGTTDREHLLMALADLDAILIKATYTTTTKFANLQHVYLDTAINQRNGPARALEVEECSCPEGYKGLSCESCTSGYYKSDEGTYLGICEKCNCNGRSEDCHPETGECFNCRDGWSGPRCEVCSPGYREEGGRCVGGQCLCDSRGSRTQECTDGRCDCKVNVEGPYCDRCKDGTVHLSADNILGCSSCYCSDVSKICRSSNLYYQPFPMQILDTISPHGFILTDRRGDVKVRDNFILNPARNEIGYSLNMDQDEYFWSLPPKFTGEKLTSYGGNLTFTRRFVFHRFAFIDSDYDVILNGNSKSVYWQIADYPQSNNTDLVEDVVVSLIEGKWRLLDTRTGHAHATKTDLMEILSQLSSILIRASAGPDILQTYLSDVALDIAIDQRSDHPALAVEMCSCPPNHMGTSCQQCVEHYYRAYDKTCKRCECNDREESCSLGANNELYCNCHPDYFGKRCEYNRNGSSGNTPLPIPPPINITISDSEPSIQIKQVGSSVRYRCSGISQSQQGRVRLSWSKSGGELPFGRAKDDLRGNLEIVDLRVSDSGTYVCTASDGISSQTGNVFLRVGGDYSAPEIHLSSSQIHVNEGQQIEVTCSGIGSPLPTLEWHRLDNGTFNSQVIIRDGYLRIPFATRRDAGVYECIARNSAGSVSATVTVSINPGPSPQPNIYPPSFNGDSGERFSLECVGDSSPDDEIEWRREDGGIYSGQRQGNALVFNRPVPEDSGVYFCIIRSRSTGQETSSVSASITIRGTGLPRPSYPSVTPEQQRVGQGLTAEFICNVPSDNINNIRWYKANGDISSRAEYLNNGRILRIRDLAFEDRGIYVCYVVHQGRSYNLSAILEIERRERPRIEIYPSDSRQILSVGNSLLLQCRAEGIPTPTIRWSRGDNSALPPHIIPAGSGTLRFNQVQLTDAGEYICTADNDAGRDTARAYVEVQSPPEIKVFPKDIVHLVAGQNLDLTCIAEGTPTPTVEWTRRTPYESSDYPSQNEVTAQPNYGQAEYQVFQVSSEDEGIYWCIAQNEARREFKAVQVYVEDYRGPVSQPSGDNEDFWVAIGGDTQITCALEGSRNLERRWVRADRNPFPLEVTQHNGTLFIRGATHAAQGEYICQLYDEQGRVESRIGRFLSVKELPEITLYPPKQVVRPGDDAEIRCSARGDQPIEITWEANHPLPPSVTVIGGLLRFKGITESDAGRYICKAKNIAGLREAAADVLVNENLNLRARVSVVGEPARTTIQGSLVTLQCTSDPPSTISWSKTPGVLSPSSIIEGETLKIMNVQPQDTGRYICSIRSADGAISTDHIDLTVTRDPTCPGGFQCLSGECIHYTQRCDNYQNCADRSDEKDCPRIRRGAAHIRLKIEPSIDIIRVGSTVDLRCLTEGLPSSKIEWTKIGETNLGPNVKIISSNVLRISDVTTSNAGPYRCSAQTDSGSYTDVYTLNVQEILPSELPPPAVKTIVLKLGQTADISCSNDLEPPVSYTWLRKGGLPENAVTEEGKLTLNHVTSNDYGLYTCVATNGEVKMDIDTFVVVQGTIPRFSSNSYVKLKTLFDAYMQFDIEILFKPEDPNGLILYNGRQPSAVGGSDFVSFGLRNGYPEFRFDMGSGHATIVGRKPLPMGKWVKALLNRNRKEGRLAINNEDPVIRTSQGRHQGLDLDLPLYIGSVPDFSTISKSAEFNRGFKGCISRLIIKNEEQNLTQAGSLDWVNIEECDSCAENLCTNSAACQEAANARGYICLCTKKFSGENCDRPGESCYTGLCGGGYCENTERGFVCKCPLGLIGNNCENRIKVTTPSFTDSSSYLAYSAPRDTSKIDITLKLNPTDSRDALILYAAQNDFGTGNYISIAVKERRLELRIDSGSGSPIVLKSNKEIIPGTWMTINAGRDAREARLSIGNDIVKTTLTFGQRRELGLRTFLYLGGFDTSTGSINPNVNVTDGFRGCISYIDVSRMDLDILRSAKESSNIAECPSGNPCRENPCRHGATCLPDGPRYTCLCTPGYSGFNCEKLKNDCEKYEPCSGKGECVPLPKGFKCLCSKGFSGQNCTIREYITSSFNMQGDGWAELPKEIFADTDDNTELDLNIVTNSLNGIILWHGQGPLTAGGISDFFSIAVVNGQVEVMFELGSGLGRVVSESRVDDGRPHRIQVSRSGNYATLSVDGKTSNGHSEGILSKLNAAGNVYIGGVPDPKYMTNGRYLENFNGCIRNIHIQNSDVIDVSNSAISTVNLRRCPVNAAD